MKKAILLFVTIVALAFTTSASDLGLFGLKGNVKTLNVEGTVYSFDTEGNLILPEHYTVVRDENGHLKQLSFVYHDEEMGKATAVYLLEVSTEGLLTKVGEFSISEHDVDEQPSIIWYVREYNNEGFACKMYTIDYPDSYWTFTFPKTDAQGNWTEQIGKCSFMDGTYPTKRVITYY